MNVSGVKLTEDQVATLCGWVEVYHCGFGVDDTQVLSEPFVRGVLSAVYDALPAEVSP